MKRIKNPFRKMNVTEKQDLTCPNSYEGEDMKCCRCVRPQYPKPTKMEKKLVIKEEWCETTFEQQKDRLYVHMRYFEDDDSGGKWEGGSSSFSVPLKKLKDYLLSH